MPSKSAIPTLESEGQPLTEKEYVSTARALRILGVTETTLAGLAAEGWIRWVGCKKTSTKQVHYGSLVNFCDRIRVGYRIADRRPKLSAPSLCHRDEDLLPFPLSDTISAEKACAALGYKATMVREIVELVEGGYFEA